MTDKEIIRAEVERLKETVGAGLDAYDMGHENGAFEAYEKVLSFIDSLPEEPFNYTNATIIQKDFAEPISDDLKEAAVEYADWAIKQPKDFCISAIADYDNGITEGFKAGAQWQKEQFINKACEWLKAQEEMIGISFQEDFIERFHKAMEEEK